MIDFLVCLFGSPSLCLFCFGQLIRYADKHIVNIMKVCVGQSVISPDNSSATAVGT